MVEFQDIIKHIDEYSDQYKYAILKCALVRQPDGDFFLRGTLLFVSDEEISDESREYDSLIMLKNHMDINDAKKFIESFIEGVSPKKSNFNISGKHSINRLFHLDENPIPIGHSHRFFDWPCKVYQMHPLAPVSQEPQAPIIKKGLPIIVDTSMVLNDWIWSNREPKFSHQFDLFIIIPDYRVRINKIKIEEERILVDIKQHLLSEENIIVKGVFRGTDNENEFTFIYQKDELLYSAPLETDVNKVSIIIFEKEKYELIDWAEISLLVYDQPPEVEIVAQKKQIEYLISQGENEFIEFKSKTTDGYTIIKEIVAFSNASGGTILLGVNDDGSIGINDDGSMRGIDPTIEKSKIQNWIERFCYPQVSVQYQEQIIDGVLSILIIQIPEGNNKPYQHLKNGHYYIRKGSSAIPISRPDMDKIYQDRSTGQYLPRY